MQETNGDGRPLNKPGIYRQKETGQEIYLESTPDLGTPIIDAFMQAGFVYVGPKEEPKIEEVEAPKAPKK